LVYDWWPVANFEASWIMCNSLTHNDKLRIFFFYICGVFNDTEKSVFTGTAYSGKMTKN
jgi:hypothetical protein